MVISLEGRRNKETKSSEELLVSISGLNCAHCDIYAAGRGNEKVRHEIVESFKKERNETVDPEQVRCSGCTGQLEVRWSPDCTILLCAKERRIPCCFECENFSCKILEKFSLDGIPHHERTVENHKSMEDTGLENWIAEQKKKNNVSSAHKTSKSSKIF